MHGALFVAVLLRHVVAVSEAHDSDLATPRLNRHEKVAKDASEWVPERRRPRCRAGGVGMSKATNPAPFAGAYHIPEV